MPRPKVGAPPPPPANAKPKAIKWSERQKAERRIQRLLSFQVVQRWRGDAASICTSSELDWSAIESVVYVAGGSGGVVLARFHGAPPRLCCLKPQRMEAYGELCASILADSLQVPTASLHVLSLSSEIAGALGAARLAIDEHRVYVDKLLADAKYLGIVEFVQGPTMEGEEFVQIFEDDSQKLERFWTEAGILMAFDCLINNLDRLPLIWDNAGNLKNVMVDLNSSKPRVVGIDQAVRGISAASGLENYLKQLRCLLREVLASEREWKDSSRLLRVQTAMQANFQDKFEVDASALRQGLQEAFRRFAWRWCSGALGRALDEAMNQVIATFGCRASQLWPLRQLVEAAAATIADEVQKLQLHVLPAPILQTFRNLIPLGQMSREELLRLLQELEPRLELDDVQKFFVHSFSGSEAAIDCSKFLLRIWEGQGHIK